MFTSSVVEGDVLLLLSRHQGSSIKELGQLYQVSHTNSITQEQLIEALHFLLDRNLVRGKTQTGCVLYGVQYVWYPTDLGAELTESCLKPAA